MNILHVVAGIQETCGVSCFVMETARAQMAQGHCVCVVTSMTCGYPVGEVDVRLMNDPTMVNFKPDIVHLHSIWNVYVHKMATWCRSKCKPYIISPHGTLTAWALRYHWWKKIPAMVLYQYNDLVNATAFHVTVNEEVEDIKRLSLKQPIVIAPLGVNVKVEAFLHNSKDILFISRIHPKKGLSSLLQAWAGINKELRLGWRIIISGPDDVGHQEELKGLAVRLGLSVRDFSQELEFGKKQIHGGNEVPLSIYQRKLVETDSNVVFTGPVYSNTKDWLYQHSRFFVLPSHSENFGGVILEALAAGTPCITTMGTPWKSLTGHHCGWWVEDGVESIQESLLECLSLSDEDYAQMHANARAFVSTNYSWDTSARTLLDAYSRICEK